MNEFKRSVISANIQAREEEIATYEVNIFNYKYILPRSQDPEFSDQISKGILENEREMKKALLVLEALYAQLESLKS